ncbi:hypothetical protein L3054_11180 [Corynebacterium sp. MC-10]|nr:hypothetical protein [Corynebacterium parakroppenstedtii]
MAALEKLLGTVENTEDAASVIVRIQDVNTELARFREIMTLKTTGYDEFHLGTLTQIEDLKKENEDLARENVNLNLEVGLLRRTMAGLTAGQEAGHSKVRIPEPNAYTGSRSAKELENFLYDIEQYFTMARIAEEDKLNIATIYLHGDAKLWWRTRDSDDVSAGRPRIDSWSKLRKEMRDQFLPSNTLWIARDKLRNLRHTGSVRDYIKDFSSLMLDIQNMSDEDKLHNFIAGMQGWAQTELRRQNVKDLPNAIAAADSLVDFRPPTESPEVHSSSQSMRKAERRKEWKKNGRKEGNDKEEPVAEAESSKKKNSVKDKGCYTCGGQHFARNCPNSKVNAVVVTSEAQAKEDEDVVAALADPLGLLLN